VPNGAPFSSAGFVLDSRDVESLPEHPVNTINATMGIIKAGNLEISLDL
jgi:hypothetical protein